jgi:hypothetical protein
MRITALILCLAIPIVLARVEWHDPSRHRVQFVTVEPGVRIQKIKAAKGGARVVELWDANHVVFLSNPDEVLQGMRKFIKD